MTKKARPKVKAVTVANVILTPGHRVCLGCGGSGIGHLWTGGDLVERYELCLACGGDGELPNAKPGRADTMADAETLRLYFADGRLFTGRLYPVGWLTFQMRSPHYGVRKMIERGWAGRAGARAVHLARAVFDAVPGLRGE